MSNFFATVDGNDCMQGSQGQVVSAVMDRKVLEDDSRSPKMIYRITIIFSLTKKFSTRLKEAGNTYWMLHVAIRASRSRVKIEAQHQ
jgi:hypothetical protein